MSGVVYAFKTQRHMRFHLYAVVFCVLMGIFLDLRLREMIVVLFMISLVVVAEMFNSAIEAVVDLVEPNFHPLAKLAKDMAAGAVLITTTTALVVAMLLFIGDGRWQEIALQLTSTEKQQQFVPKVILGIFLLFMLVVIGKGLGKRGQVLKGGLVSGHAAVGFFLAGALVFLTKNVVATGIAVFLAAMIAQSRWEARIHSVFELTTGAALGSALSILLFGFTTK